MKHPVTTPRKLYGSQSVDYAQPNIAPQQTVPDVSIGGSRCFQGSFCFGVSELWSTALAAELKIFRF